METKVCCFIGPRKIDESENIVEALSNTIEKLIVNEKIGIFLFGSQSSFNKLCYDLLTQYKETYPYIKRVYVRAEYPYISDSYKRLLLKEYEDTYFPERIIGAGKASYLERNEEMIKRSDICVLYYRECGVPKKWTSGTKSALEYAIKKKKRIIMI